MMNTTFAVGPSQLYAATPLFFQEIYESGILSESHRGAAFCSLMQETLELLHAKLSIPEDYKIVFAGSATESWEIIAQSLTLQGSTHYYSGSFGEKWFSYAKSLHPLTVGIPFDCQNQVPYETGIVHKNELVCFTQNETSNGTQIDIGTIKGIRNAYLDAMIAYDCTSSMGGIDLPWEYGDIWYASVQKCFGLPAGLGIMILSPNAVSKAYEINEKNHYNSLVSMLDMIAKYQTTFTPNVLGIALLHKVLQMIIPIKEIHDATVQKAANWYDYLSQTKSLQPLIHNTKLRSLTVLAVHCEGTALAYWKEKSKKSGVPIGGGYGAWKESSFRIANFPAIPQSAITKLQEVLNSPFHPNIVS